MGTRQPENIRNLSVVAHGGAGKSSLLEAMLFDNGCISRMGKIEDGNTVTDFTPEEQKRQISINTSLVTMERRGTSLYILDTPGFADFIGEMRSAMRVSDAALVAISSVSGIEVQTDKAWEYAQDFNLPVAFYVSKMDRENADFDKVLAQLREEYSDKTVAAFLPSVRKRRSRESSICCERRPMFSRRTGAESLPKRLSPTI